MATTKARKRTGATQLSLFIEAVESLLLWDRLKKAPHQAGNLEGITIGDFGADEDAYEYRKNKAAQWIAGNAQSVAAAFSKLGHVPDAILEIGNLVEDADNGPAAVRAVWPRAKAALQPAMLRGTGAKGLTDDQPAVALPDESAFVAASKIGWQTKLDSTSYKTLHAFLDANLQIRHRSPSERRLEIHAGDWARYWSAEEAKALNDNNSDQGETELANEAASPRPVAKPDSLAIDPRLAERAKAARGRK